MYPEKVNPNCFALSNPKGQPILDGDTKRILEICNEGNIAEVKELILLVPERKLDGHVPPCAATLYEDETFAASAAEFLTNHNRDDDDYMPFTGMVYHVVVKGFVCEIIDSLTVNEQ